jgi:hypothetical protein
VSTELLVIGCSGLAKEAAQLARDIDPDGRRWHRIAYVSEQRQDPPPRLPFGELRYCDADLPTLGQTADVVIGIGLPAVRRKVATRLAALPHLSFPNLVHPSAAVDPAVVSLGRGNAVCRNVVFTCDITVGDFNWFNIGVIVGHDGRKIGRAHV